MSYTQSKITRMGEHSWPFWKKDDRITSGNKGFEIHWSDDGECVTDHVYTEADANLIASAPLLLETIKLLHLLGGLGSDKHKLLQIAIEAAEGKRA